MSDSSTSPTHSATLHFPLPECEAELLLAVHAADWEGVAWEMDQWLRGKLKYGNDYKTADEALDAAREHLRESVSARGVTFEEK